MIIYTIAIFWESFLLFSRLSAALERVSSCIDTVLANTTFRASFPSLVPGPRHIAPTKGLLVKCMDFGIQNSDAEGAGGKFRDGRT